MLLIVSFIFALAGVGFAGTAALLPDTGINGTPGAFLAFAGAVAASTLLGSLLVRWVPTKARWVFAGIAGLTTVLTALAAWFLMQNGLVATMVLALMALLVSRAMADRTIRR